MLAWAPWIFLYYAVVEPVWTMARFAARRLLRRPREPWERWSWWWPVGPAFCGLLFWLSARPL